MCVQKTGDVVAHNGKGRVTLYWGTRGGSTEEVTFMARPEWQEPAAVRRVGRCR